MITINTPTQTIELLPTDRTNITELKSLLVEVYKTWIDCGFDIASTVANRDAWAMLQAAIDLLPRKDNPAASWSDLESIGNDYQQIERLFFVGGIRSMTGEWDVEKLDLDQYVPPEIVRVHLLNGRRLMFEADRLRKQDAALQSPD